MRVGRQYLGKEVRVTWRDPHQGDRIPLDSAPKGKAALATWTEWGRIDDLTDGIVRLVHSEAKNPPYESEPGVEVVPTYIPEELIEDIVVLEPTRERAPNGDS